MKLKELRDATREEHKKIEQSLDLVRPSVTITEYAGLLIGYRKFLRLWEPRILDVLVCAMPGFAGPRMKLAWVEDDLLHLRGQVLPEAFSDADGNMPRLPVLESVGQALGSMYVLEGSALGGQILSRHFEEHLGIKASGGCRYLSGYGRDTGAMWKNFCDVLESRPPDEDSTMTRTAIETFQVLREWLPASLSAHSATRTIKELEPTCLIR